MFGTLKIDIAWLDIDSPAHVALKDVVLSQKLLKDVGKLSDSMHTGSLEVYHSMLLKYAPKRQHFNYIGSNLGCNWLLWITTTMLIEIWPKTNMANLS